MATAGKKWWNLFLVSAAHAETHVQTSAYSLIYIYVMRYFGIDYAQLGLLIGAANFVSGLLQGIYGWLSSSIKRKYLCGGGNIIVGLTMMGSALSSSFPLFSFFRVAGAVGSSPQHPVASSLIADWFEKRERGRALTIHTTAGNVGTVAAPLLVGFTVNFLGWRDVLLVLGIPGLLFGVLVMLMAYDIRATISFKSSSASIKRYADVLRDPNLLRLYAARAVIAGGRGLGVALVYIPLYLANVLHLSSVLVGELYTLLAVGSVISPLLGSHIADYLGKRKIVIVPSLLISAAGTITLTLSGADLAGVIVGLVLIGTFLFSEGPLSQAMLSDIVKDELRDAGFSVYYTSNYVSGSAWGTALGFIVSYFGFTTLFWVMTASYLVGAAIISTVAERG